MTNDTGFVLKPMDRIVFLGDSITEQHLYTNYVESYLASRFPELKLTFFNAGWGGDVAPGGAMRLQRDVLNLKPTVVTICYGMNDARYTQPTEEIRTTFVRSMRELVSRLKAAGIRVVLLTPGMADGIANPGLGEIAYNERGLRILADEVLNLAREEELPCADLHRLMNEVNVRGKAADPTFCMMPDGFHPEPAGHLVMAFGALQALGVPPRRQVVTADCTSGQTTATGGITVRRLRRHEAGFRLDLRMDSLPFFVEPAARKVLPFLAFQETFNELRVCVRGLATSHGTFRGDGVRSAVLSREQFETGLNLFDEWRFPPVRQAEAFHRYTAEKDQIYFRLWRGLALNNENSSFYNARLHAGTVRLGPVLERGRERLVAKSARDCSLNILSLEGSADVLVDGDFVRQWSLLGHFPGPFDKDLLDGEAAFTAKTPVLGSKWVDVEVEPNGYQWLTQVFGQQTSCFAYAVATIESPVGQKAALLLGSDDGIAAWMNGEAVHNNLQTLRGLAPDQDKVNVRLKAGTNVLLLKISQGTEAWGFCARLTGLRRPVHERRPGRA